MSTMTWMHYLHFWERCSHDWQHFQARSICAKTTHELSLSDTGDPKSPGTSEVYLGLANALHGVQRNQSPKSSEVYYESRSSF